MKRLKKYFVKHTKKCESNQKKDTCDVVIYGGIGIFGIIALWWILGGMLFSFDNYKQFSSFMPIPTVNALIDLFLDNRFWTSVIASLKRVTIGIIIAFIAGMPLGILIGYYRILRFLMNPGIHFFRMISPVSLMPVALLLFKQFESAIYFLITMSTIWPIIVNTIVGVSRVNSQWIQMARIEGAGHREIILKIILPAAIPYMLTSLRLAIGVAWIVLVPAEFLGISSGLGYLINDARDTMEYDRLLAIIISIGIIGFFLDTFVQWVYKTLNWHWIN